MTMPFIPGLQPDIWASTSKEARIQSLNELEVVMAARENREPAIVSSEDLGFNTWGAHGFDDQGVERIYISSEWIEHSSPFQAVETCLHEDEHAHQAYTVKNPNLAENDQQLQDWNMSEKGGYIQSGDFGYLAYRFQPVEDDANEVARSKTDDLFQNTYGDNVQYPAHKTKKEQENADNIEDAKDKLGENYKETSRNLMVEKFLNQHQQENVTETKKNSLETQGTIIVPQSNLIEQSDIEKPEELPSMPGATSEDRAGIETLSTTELPAIEGKEMTTVPELKEMNDMSPEFEPQETKDNPNAEEEGYSYGFLR